MIERDTEILISYESGTSRAELANKFDLSVTRIAQIINRLKMKRDEDRRKVEALIRLKKQFGID